jgi:adenylate cyclase
MGNLLFLSSHRGKILIGSAIGALAWVLLFLIYWAGLIESFELKAYDQLCRLTASPAPNEIALVAVDQGSLQAAQKQGISWPWPRQMYAPIVDFCTTAGARAVVFDVLFTEPSSYGMEDDRILAEALTKNRRGILPLFLSREKRDPQGKGERFMERASLPIRNRSGRSPQPYYSAVPPIPILVAGCHRLGNVAIDPDGDGIYRRLPVIFSYHGQWIASLGFAALQDSKDLGPWILQKDGLFWERKRIPLSDRGDFLLTYYGGERDFPRFSAFNVVQSFLALQEGKKPLYSPQVFKDRIVFIGFTAPGLFDLKPTPIRSINPGMAIHATFAANLIHGDFRTRASFRANLILAAVVALAMGIAVLYLSGLWHLMLLTLTGTGALVFTLYFSFRQNLWLDGILLLSNLGLTFALGTAFSYATEGRQRRQIRQMFSHYMSDLLIQDLLRNPTKLRLGGEKRVLTVFFSDLAGFTSLSEKLNPEQVVFLLNRYLTAMTDIILAGGGLIDKYEGDAIMAFWGAPLPQEDHALRACLAALENQRRLAELREEFVRAGLPPIYARIGLNTGEMIIGNMGSNQRFDFTVIGDSVNLASRLEGAGKEYGTFITLSEETYRQAAGQIEVRELDLLRVKGKDQPVRIYELLAKKGQLDETGEKILNGFAAGLERYRRQEWSQAISFFQEILALRPGDGPARTFLRRCENFHNDPPGADWDGVYRLTSK